MATVILALGDPALQRLCERELSKVGHSPVAISRPLELIDLDKRVRGDVLLVDGSSLGRDAARAGAVAYANRFVGLAVEAPGVQSLSLPLEPWRLIDAVERLCGAQPLPGGGLTLDASRRVARASGREVALTRTEFQLLEALQAHRGREISQDEAMEAVWGAGDWSGSIGVLRAHVRNLRLKLAQIGLANAVRSLRGRGYALAV